MPKHLQRISAIFANATRQIMTSVFGIITPFMVIHYFSKGIWGGFVPILLYTLMAIAVVNWGNKEFLLRKFSREPARINFDYSQNLFTRLPLLLLFSCLGFFCFPLYYGIFILLWLTGRYLTHTAEALIMYEKKFKASFWIELSCFMVFCILFYMVKQTPGLFPLLVIYSFYQFIRGGCFFILFLRVFNRAALKIDWSYYRDSLPFFLLSLLGLLASKADVYIINHYADRETVANYQVINGLLIFIMSIASYMYAPFTKNIYRNNTEVVGKAKRLLIISGFLIIPIALVAVHYILKIFLHVEYSWFFYLVAFLYIYPAYGYGIEIVTLFKQHQERKVTVYLFTGVLINILLSWILLRSGFGLIGVLSGSAFSQWLLLLFFRKKRLLKLQ
ncbi:hypothetical protein [Flavobacterium pallidum]|uniref:Polysaccharide biosynthesis protein C-terminal domain-containing protein n=1 Tax=Flavobacterium pallidum TaxID=2172098 RepID=A0A2S1SG35_9FLAO|nr:hypothetical protein [Flavobacterium pallidum]AWI25360.1 hypothetical protein HYN49_05295 [Flavobacterium pallidum]